MKRKLVICMIIVVSNILILTSCNFDSFGLSETKGDTESGFWIRNESYFVDYAIEGDRIQFRYSFCFQNLSDYDLILYSIGARFRKRDLKDWLKYEKRFDGVPDNSDHEIHLKSGQKMNVVLVFEGEYLGGEVNKDIYIKRIIMAQRIEPKTGA